ncbi:GNAT family N-acetyltransferase [Shewanella eurypsychrophilus]|uniref:GNAT family N-acetyltransferase n=1 Tax=Shewanella eurypsychrophilus TaxID=2593656 RepID=A0ABX6V3V4_9GAMM|nr:MULTISPECIES: GNAT family N-acetyltransferase [Shewanella]QFU21961.1 GNAT family N-acetyltransferase [Shewanella sp. YLB-09]QPG57250.1 GNAT family N-acetyltransferase [Shewanella eurypsychrophilus]
MKMEVLIADYLDEQHGRDIGYLLNHYAEDPMGGGEPLADYVKQNLAQELSKVPHAFSVICYVEGKPAGLINCFEAFSTFKCKPLINIHDIVVVNEFRGLGISQSMLAKVEERAKEKGCCKITLEVLEGNEIARNSYIKFGFDGYELDPNMGKALFWQKVI